LIERRRDEREGRKEASEEARASIKVGDGDEFAVAAAVKIAHEVVEETKKGESSRLIVRVPTTDKEKEQVVLFAVRSIMLVVPRCMLKK